MKGIINTSSVSTKSFDKELVRDITDMHLPKSAWSYARNAVPDSEIGDLGRLGNEQANRLCAMAPYKIIGVIHIGGPEYAIFSTDNTDSEIGRFNEDLCRYTRVVNDRCLGFKDTNLISGVYRETEICTKKVYWDDGGLNVSRVMDIDNPPFKENCYKDKSGCLVCDVTDELDCDKIRLAPLVSPPCYRLKLGPTGGEMPNGSYFISIAYLINGQRVTNYFTPSNIQPIFTHANLGGSLDIKIDSIDDTFDEFELVLVSTFNSQTVARRVGVYSTRQSEIHISSIQNTWTTVDINLIPLNSPVVESSDSMYTVSDYLIRVGPKEKFAFNYQPLANQIGAKWVSVEYNADYYRKGGSNTSYLRDEVYAFFIRWIFSTGDKSASFHIPGRAFDSSTDAGIIAGNDAFVDIRDGVTPYRWRVYNTATVTDIYTPALDNGDGGFIVAKGKMGYWESTEEYDDKKPLVWNATSNPIWGTSNIDYDLCGKKIRHHRMPDNFTNGNSLTNHYYVDPISGEEKIRILGVEFNNIKPPLDNNGNPIQGIVGYEILRGSREGNKTVIAKGIINNMRKYKLSTSVSSNRTGLYQNYPYNPLDADPLMLTRETSQNSDGNNAPYKQTDYSQSEFTFHSPETSFKDPFLSMKEMKIYSEMNGETNGMWKEVDNHPKHKIITNLTFFSALLHGIGFMMTRFMGDSSQQYEAPKILDIGFRSADPTGTITLPNIFTMGSGMIGAPRFPLITPPVVEASNAAVIGELALNAGLGGMTEMLGSATGSSAIVDTASGLALPVDIALATEGGGFIGHGIKFSRTLGPAYSMGFIGAIPSPQGTPIAQIGYLIEGAEATVRMILATSAYNQHAVQYISHCLYKNSNAPLSGNIRKTIDNSIYVSGGRTDFGKDFTISNNYRGRTVALTTGTQLVQNPLVVDNSRQSMKSLYNSGVANAYKLNTNHRLRASSHYVGLKQRLLNQYGQIEGIPQVPIHQCKGTLGRGGTSSVLFGGDTYIGRYTEKNTYFFFHNWLLGQPDGTEFNYKQNYEVIYPRYAADLTDFNIGETIVNISNLFGLISSLVNNDILLPSQKHNFDTRPGTIDLLIKKNDYFYLFYSGVRDFFVESEYNIDLRDWGEEDTERHYDPYLYSDTESLFNSGIIKSGNYYKYDDSLSIKNIYSTQINWGSVYNRDYDPFVAEKCYVYKPRRVIYSLPQHLENKKDYWRVFAPNNYADFISNVTCVKSVNKTGALILLDKESPRMFNGVDQLQTDGGVKLTIGDGGLFNQPMQNISNSEATIEYGSCQNRLSAINTPNGVYWMSQNQGKVFSYGNGLNEISSNSLKWWFAKFLPYKLTEQFPNFELKDNPVVGIGCQVVYDNKNQLIYFSKKDYKLKSDIPFALHYLEGSTFRNSIRQLIELGDPMYFDDVSWTVSYDPKTNGWVSYHDWHQDLSMPTKGTFFTTKDNGIWVHNDRCDLYCNYYGIDYPFEVEFETVTPQIVNSIRSVEYFMEVYEYADNCYDRFHSLNANFNEAVVYNTEQCSGLLNLRLTPYNNAVERASFPRINNASIDILFSKEEQKYRFNQFWDVTENRGEFNPNIKRVIWNTSDNGYTRTLNGFNLNYNKLDYERKKFRHYKNNVLLRKTICRNQKFLVTLTNTKELVSMR